MRKLLWMMLCVSLVAQAPKKVVRNGALLAVSEGGGQVRLLISPPVNAPLPPGGWRVQTAEGTVLLPSLKAADPDALKLLPPEDALEAASFPKTFQDEKDPSARAILALSALLTAGNRPDVGRAMGLSCTLLGQSSGRRGYAVVGLDTAGGSIGPRLVSAEVDPGTASPVPGAPTSFRAEAGHEAVRLYWSPVQGGDIPVIDYRIQRGEQLLTSGPNLMGLWDAAKPAFEDREAPGDQASEYRVWAVDVFGRRGPQVAAGVYFPDPATLRPPTHLAITAEEGANQLRFQTSPTRRSAGVLVERGLTPFGPFELVTAKPLPANADQFSDGGLGGGLGGGVTYYYRLRIVDTEGNVGEPGAVIHAIARSAGKPAAPANFKVDSNPLGCVLTWMAPDHPVAGFLVERRMGEGAWMRLGDGLCAGRRFEDLLADGISGFIEYRISTVTLDNLQSDPSPVSRIQRVDQTRPPVPVIEGIDGRGGRVCLKFRPAAPEARSAQFLVVRSARKEDEDGSEVHGPELVIGDPLPASAREFTDTWVDASETYQYRLVALSPEGVRSELTQGVEVRVSPAELPEPPVPVLAFQEQPFRCVKVTLPSLPEGVRAYLHRKGPGERLWTQVVGPFESLEVMDGQPLSGSVQYRVHLEDAKGLIGRSGAAITVRIP